MNSNEQKMTSAMSKRINNAEKYPHLDEMHPDDRAGYLAGKYAQKDKVRFLCAECNKYYEQTIERRRRGTKHSACSHKNRGKSRRLGEDYHSFDDLTPEFQEKCRNKEITTKDRVDFVCPVCKKVYTTILGSHEKGGYCGSCASKLRRSACQARTDYDFIDDIHPDDRHLIEQGKVNNKAKVRIKCSDCGEYFAQVIASRTNGFTRCKACGMESTGAARRRREYEFINPVRADYAEAIANGKLSAQDRAIFVCPMHGEYEQIIISAQKHGCQACSLGGSPYDLYNFLLTLTDNVIVNDRQQIWPKEIDFYLPDYKVGFEFNDIYTHRTAWREELKESSIIISKPVKYHQDKHQECQDIGIRLFQIWDVEWQDDRLRPILQSVIRNALGQNTRKIYARKCELDESNSKECNLFFLNNHIQGRAKGKGYFALKYEDEIVGAVCYTNNQRVLTESDAVTISRMCFAKNTTVVGGASRLLNAVIKKTKCSSIEYLVLNDYFDGVSFEKTGWTKIGINPMVRYYDRESGKLYYRQIKRRNEFKQRCLDGKMYRYYTSGTTVYKKTTSPP